MKTKMQDSNRLRKTLGIEDVIASGIRLDNRIVVASMHSQEFKDKIEKMNRTEHRAKA